MPSHSNSYAFEKIEGSKAQKFLDRLNTVWSGSAFDSTRTVIHMRALPFSSNWYLAEVSDSTTVSGKKCFALDNKSECVPIEFTADFISGFAAKHQFSLTRDTATDYVRFWFEYARTGPEKFLLIENFDDLPWREEPTPQARKTLSKTIMPLTMIQSTKDSFVFTASVLFRDTLFDTNLSLNEKGEVQFIKRQVVAEGLTVTDQLSGF